MNAFFNVKNYKSLLKSTIETKKQSTKGYSQKLAEHMQVHPSLLSQVLNGHRDFSEEQLLAACQFLGFQKLETKYLLTLLQLERAGTVLLKDHYHEVLESIRATARDFSKRAPRDKELTDAEKAQFYSHWHYAAIHLLTSLNVKMSFEDISEKLALTHARTKEVLDFLIEAGMVVKTKDSYQATTLATHLNRGSPFLAKHHTNWRLKAVEATDELQADEMMYTAICSIEASDFQKFKDELTLLLEKFVSMVQKSEGEEIAQLGIDFLRIRK
jgi:uncharacterized protein (TIGR02147 family)